jgi:hypothetical protein
MGSGSWNFCLVCSSRQLEIWSYLGEFLTPIISSLTHHERRVVVIAISPTLMVLLLARLAAAMVGFFAMLTPAL